MWVQEVPQQELRALHEDQLAQMQLLEIVPTEQVEAHGPIQERILVRETVKCTGVTPLAQDLIVLTEVRAEPIRIEVLPQHQEHTVDLQVLAQVKTTEVRAEVQVLTVDQVLHAPVVVTEVQVVLHALIPLGAAVAEVVAEAAAVAVEAAEAVDAETN